MPIIRFNYEEMKRYWAVHSFRRATLDFDRDPEGLDIVCHTGAPLWLNRYYARYQKMVYEKLFSLLPFPRLGARALDVGCGTGRWCRFLAERGYRVTGIDWQQELIESNRARCPEIQYLRTSIQEFAPEEPFDLVSSVTVLQHIPFSEQEAAIHKLRELTKDGGHALVLENTREQAVH